ncbi:unnamed protein product [Urochloa humidicola]
MPYLDARHWPSSGPSYTTRRRGGGVLEATTGLQTAADGREPPAGDLRILYDCDWEDVEFASTTQVPNSMAQVIAAAQKLKHSNMDIPTRESGPAKVTTPEGVATKDAELQEGDPSKTTKIGVGLTPI